MTHDASFQGRLFVEQSFPSQASVSLVFSAKSRCLIDMGNVFIVVPEGDDLQPFQRSIFRLKGNRQSMTFADDTRLSMDDCKVYLLSKFDQLPHCGIVGVNFPFFHQEEIEQGLNKYRPCVTLYGEGEQTPLFVGAFMGAVLDNRFGLLLSPPDIKPSSAPAHLLVDCTKLCSFLEVYNRSGSYLHRKPTWQQWLTNPEGPESLSNILRPASPETLRMEIVKKLTDLLSTADPIVDYRDVTLALDIGTLVEGYKIHEDELCNFTKVYKGPPAPGSWCHPEGGPFRPHNQSPNHPTPLGKRRVQPTTPKVTP